MSSNVYDCTKPFLFQCGVSMSLEFLKLNGLTAPTYSNRTLSTTGKPQGSYGCGMYSPQYRTVIVTVDRCAKPAQGQARQWSFPGYTADRTPVGVVSHETGHAVDHQLANASKLKSWQFLVRDNPRERITSYEPDASEAFAETMRLFITNPLLLCVIAPKRYAFLRWYLELKHEQWPDMDPLSKLKHWGASQSILTAASNKVKAAVKWAGKTTQ